MRAKRNKRPSPGHAHCLFGPELAEVQHRSEFARSRIRHRARLDEEIRGWLRLMLPPPRPLWERALASRAK